MIKKYIKNKVLLIEASVIIVPLSWFFIYRIVNPNYSPELIINSIFLILAVTLFIFRSPSLRHMYLAFIFIVLATIGNMFGLDNFVYVAGSLAISLITLGALNMFLFRKKEDLN